ncbi:uncharacterized protein N7496_012641 [Penicillium cataractarum]|uniref:F-box domain-containing protein n=1 Tax=Penicillium cataractarum TaxID=2100454 RepID=A0A9W9RAW2_9EURO|nr:uncharacterized protein N7496_012641 [Penicillium cataractarum]KAJ5355429.1 hypothetical protein N7496_012641 [Penicillium cataractarum]
MPFSNLPPELLLLIGEHLEWEEDLHNFCLVNRRCSAAINDLLYRRVVDNLHRGIKSSALEWAATHGKIDCVRELLKAGVPPSTVCHQPWHPIILAAKNGHRDVLQLFLDAGVDPNPPTGFYLEPGIPHRWELEEEEEEEDQEAQGEAEAEAVDREFARMQQATEEQVQELQWQEVQEEQEEDDSEEEHDQWVLGKTGNPLTFAIANGHDEIVHLLINRGVEVEYPADTDEFTQPLAVAAQKGNLPLIQFLLEKGCSPYICDDRNRSAFAYAAAHHGTELLQAFIDAGADPRINETTYTVLYAAVEGGNTAGFEYLIEHGVDPDGPQEKGLQEYLFRATVKRHFEVARIILSMIDIDDFICGAERMKFHVFFLSVVSCGFMDVVERCLEKRTVSDRDFWTTTVGMALQSSARDGDTKMSELLLNYGVDVNGPEGGLDTPLYYVVHSRRVRPNFIDMVKLLLDRGASMYNMGVTHSLFITALILGKVEIARELLRRLDQSQIDVDMRSTGLIQFAVAGGVPGLQLRAARSANVELLKIFLDAGFDANSIDPTPGHGSMHVLTTVLTCSRQDDAEAAAELLLERGADIEARNELTDETPLLFMAGRTGSPPRCRIQERAARFLLKNGANMFFVNNRGQSPLAKAACKGNIGIVKILLEHLSTIPLASKDWGDTFVGAYHTEYRDIRRVLSRWFSRQLYPPLP